MAKGYSARGGFTGGAGMMRQQQQMQQKILKMQQEMEKAQADVENATFSATAGGGVVKATVSGKRQLTELTIQPEAVDPEDVEMLQDLVISAVNEAMRQAEDAMESSMAEPYRWTEHPRLRPVNPKTQGFPQRLMRCGNCFDSKKAFRPYCLSY